jgi:hypothetical protein
MSRFGYCCYLLLLLFLFKNETKKSVPLPWMLMMLVVLKILWLELQANLAHFYFWLLVVILGCVVSRLLWSDKRAFVMEMLPTFCTFEPPSLEVR